MKQVKERIDQLFPQLVEWRRNFHQHPELSFHEEKTSQFVADFLHSLGLEVRTHIGGGYGVTGLLRGGEPGPTIALRADMDALPIPDEKSCAYRSQVPDVMHACGHDGHMTMLMGSAIVLSELKNSIRGNILFLFQHAEELLPGGAKGMIEDGVLEGVDVVYGIHLMSTLPTGKIAVRPGQWMAAADSFELELVGKGGHGGMPHEAVDAIVLAAQVVNNLQTIVSRRVDPLQPNVITVGKIEGGQAFNVIAERCRLIGTVRTFNTDIREQIVKQMEEVIHGTCQMVGADYRFNYTRGYPPVINDAEETHRVIRVAEGVVGKEHVHQINPMMGGEDFAYYLQQRPGTFWFVGAGNQERGIIAPHHHPQFDFDEAAMKIGIETFVATVFDYLQIKEEAMLR